MKVSRHFRLGLSQSQLDFVDVDPTGDTDLYVDPYALEIKQDAWSNSCGDCIRTFFQELLNAIRIDNEVRSQELISHLHEPQETYLGMSKGRPDGKGLAETQGNEILAALKKKQSGRDGCANRPGRNLAIH